tara:strand:- start:1157 stop:1753 length:597 start_codon:yes stop_codon:yes gene_type:complete
MLRVGLTGGIASGKTAVADYFAKLGADIVDTDNIAREVVAIGEPGLEKIQKAFGPKFFFDSGELDRNLLRKLIFSDSHQRKKLEEILHPLIRKKTLEKLDSISAPYVIAVVPLLVETNFQSLVNRVAVVDCSIETQLDRLLARDKLDKIQAKSILEAQANRNVRVKSADDLINNDGNWKDTCHQIKKLHTLYSNLGET